METTVYNPPESDLERKDNRPLTASEKLEQSRRDMQAAAARSRLNLIWGFRLAVDVLAGALAIYLLYMGVQAKASADVILGLIILLMYGLEIIPIIGFFRQKAWSIIPLHIFSAISLLNIPFGTLLSIIHYVNAGKLQFEK